MTVMNRIEIKPLTKLDAMHTAVELQKVFWGHDLESIVPAHMLYSLARHGGHVLAAFDGERMVGVLIDFLGTNHEGHLQLVSKRMVVLPDYRGQGIGYQLKCTQRRLALLRGLDLVTWTFDPLMALNAHLNIHKLGAVSRIYFENYYGTGGAGNLATLGYSDRLLAEWWVGSPHAEGHLNDESREAVLSVYLNSQVPIANESLDSDEHDFPIPPDDIQWPQQSLILLEIPLDYPSMVVDESDLAIRWRLHTRELFQRLFAERYVMGGFIHTPYHGRERGFYVLSNDSHNQFI
jgi:chorismate synthase